MNKENDENAKGDFETHLQTKSLNVLRLG